MECEIFEEPCADEPCKEEPSAEKPSMDLSLKESCGVNNIKIKQYMLAVVFNAPNTIDNFYKLRVNYDLNRYA